MNTKAPELPSKLESSTKTLPSLQVAPNSIRVCVPEEECKLTALG